MSNVIINQKPQTDLRTSDFFYDLPQELIAQHLHPKYPGLWEPTDAWNKEWANDREWS